MPIFPRRSACLRCLIERVPDAGSTETCDTAGILSTAVNLAASVQVTEALKLLTGQYLIVPASSTAAISEQMNDMQLLNGYLVPKSIARNADPTTVAQSALPNVTYATLKVSVQPAADVALSTASKSGSSGGGGGHSGDDSSSGDSKKKTDKPPAKKKPD